MARKSLLATLLGVAALAVPSASADKGGIAHDGSNGQGRPADQTQTQTQTQTKTQGKALAKGRAKAHTKAKGHVKQQAQSTPAANPHAKAGKTTLCHATGSTTNPYVTITISNNAVPAHQRHQDGRDIIPVPEGGCPTAPAGQQQQTTSESSTPSGQEQAAAPQTTGASTTAGTPASGRVLGETTSGSSTPSGSSASPNKVSVLGASTSGGSPSASSSPAATATRSSSSSGLPFTGTNAILVAILGLALLLAGVTARRVATTSRAR